MALSDNQSATQALVTEAFRAQMEASFPLPEEMPEEEKEKIRDNWLKLGQAVAAALPALMLHIVDNAEIGTVVSEVEGGMAYQINVGGGLLE